MSAAHYSKFALLLLPLRHASVLAACCISSTVPVAQHQILQESMRQLPARNDLQKSGGSHKLSGQPWRVQTLHCRSSLPAPCGLHEHLKGRLEHHSIDTDMLLVHLK